MIQNRQLGTFWDKGMLWARTPADVGDPGSTIGSTDLSSRQSTTHSSYTTGHFLQQRTKVECIGGVRVLCSCHSLLYCIPNFELLRVAQS